MTHQRTKAIDFALEILREHPQISFQHAVSAAGYSHVEELSIAEFHRAQQRLGIPLEVPSAPAEPAEPAAENTTATAEGCEVIRMLEEIRAQYRETEDFRAALLAIRSAVETALAQLA